MGSGGLAFGIDRVVGAIISQGQAFIEHDSSKVGLAIFWLILFFHLIEGAAEMVERPASCRLLRGKWWLRITTVAALLGGYQAVVVGTVAEVQPKAMKAFGTQWVEVWENEMQAMEAMRNAEAENRDLKYNEVSASRTGPGDDSWWSKAARYVVDGLVTALGWVLAGMAGLLITIFILFEGFYALGINMLLVAIGPICVAFGAHEKTEGIAWSFMRAFIVLGLAYMPMLALACSFAGIIMAQMTTMVGKAGLAYGDGSDIVVHFIMVLIGPICAFAVVKAVPGFLSMMLQGGSAGGGAAFAMAAGAAGTAARGGGGGMEVGGAAAAGAAAAAGSGQAGAGAGGGAAASTGSAIGAAAPAAAAARADDVRGDP